ncbi:MAG TPA: cbb3-type cytochrome c oxidase subunit 3 [Xanthomonadales bacterium]|nr:cbb3-type cytochrome c oxidase subunit 3 [Xanthomonadales bacterium]
MDLNVIRGVLLVALIIGFAGMVGWAWSRKRKPEFDRAAQLPLEEDTPDLDTDSTSGTKENKE